MAKSQYLSWLPDTDELSRKPSGLFGIVLRSSGQSLLAEQHGPKDFRAIALMNNRDAETFAMLHNLAVGCTWGELRAIGDGGLRKLIDFAMSKEYDLMPLLPNEERCSYLYDGGPRCYEKAEVDGPNGSRVCAEHLRIMQIYGEA